jgi:hypothetical protein
MTAPIPAEAVVQLYSALDAAMDYVGAQTDAQSGALWSRLCKARATVRVYLVAQLADANIAVDCNGCRRSDAEPAPWEAA